MQCQAAAGLQFASHDQASTYTRLPVQTATASDSRGASRLCDMRQVADTTATTQRDKGAGLSTDGHPRYGAVSYLSQPITWPPLFLFVTLLCAITVTPLKRRIRPVTGDLSASTWGRPWPARTRPAHHGMHVHTAEENMCTPVRPMPCNLPGKVHAVRGIA